MDIHSIPKAELHAHLNGCIRRETFLEFLQQDHLEFTFPNRVTMTDAFRIFPLVHRVINSKSRLEQIVREVLEDFEKDNCVYLELRTTPKTLPGLSKSDYLKTIEKVIQSYQGNLKASLIISVNRGQTIEEAWENLNLAKESDLCVGLDFSGNPLSGKFRDFQEVFLEARKSRLFITVHTAEMEDNQDTDDIISFRPDRLGHCIYLTEEQKSRIIELGIPIEICLSSNLACFDIAIEDHNFSKFFQSSHPLAICTDDTLLFDTCLTKEYSLISNSYSLTESETTELIGSAFRVSFSR